MTRAQGSTLTNAGSRGLTFDASRQGSSSQLGSAARFGSDQQSPMGPSKCARSHTASALQRTTNSATVLLIRRRDVP